MFALCGEEITNTNILTCLMQRFESFKTIQSLRLPKWTPSFQDTGQTGPRSHYLVSLHPITWWLWLYSLGNPTGPSGTGRQEVAVEKPPHLPHSHLTFLVWSTPPANERIWHVSAFCKQAFHKVYRKVK